MLRETLTRKVIDHSDAGYFSFSFFCDRCGEGWVSHKKAFSGGGIGVSVEKDEALRLLWGHEHRLAFDEATLDAHAHFNRCPKCGKRVCDKCFNLFGEGEYNGLCKDCS